MAFDSLRAIQPRMADELEKTTESGMMPQSLLFSGVPGSGRLTGALDEAFYLTGEDGSLLSSEHIAYFASRPFRPEIRAAYELFTRQRTDFSRCFFIRTVRRVLLQYHSSIASLHKESAGVRKSEMLDGDGTVFSAASAIDGILLEIEKSSGFDENTAALADSVMQLLTDQVLSVGKKTAGATIDEIRAIQDWLQEGTEEKAVIFENAEDYTFDEFFFAEGAGEEEKRAMDGHVRAYSDALMKGSRLSDGEEEEIFSSLEKMDGFRYFRERVIGALEEGMLTGLISAGRADAVWKALSSSLDSADTYNMSIRHALDLALREVADVR